MNRTRGLWDGWPWPSFWQRHSHPGREGRDHDVPGVHRGHVDYRNASPALHQRAHANHLKRATGLEPATLSLGS